MSGEVSGKLGPWENRDPASYLIAPQYVAVEQLRPIARVFEFRKQKVAISIPCSKSHCDLAAGRKSLQSQVA